MQSSQGSSQKLLVDKKTCLKVLKEVIEIKREQAYCCREDKFVFVERERKQKKRQKSSSKKKMSVAAANE